MQFKREFIYTWKKGINNEYEKKDKVGECDMQNSNTRTDSCSSEGREKRVGAQAGLMLSYRNTGSFSLPMSVFLLGGGR